MSQVGGKGIVPGDAFSSITTDVAGPVSPSSAGSVNFTGTSIFSDGSVANQVSFEVQGTSNAFFIGQGAGTAATTVGPLTDGQLFIGSTGSAPVAAQITSSDSSISISTGSGSIDLSLSTPISVSDGGTGRTSATEYAVICGGTSLTGALQSIASLGVSGEVLTSNGAGQLPTFQPGGGGGASPLTTKGDIYTYDSDDARLPIGTDEHCLIADSGEATGNKWGVLQEAGGGTGNSSYAQGDVLYASGANTLSKLTLPSRAGAFLMSDGTDLYWASPKNTLYIYEDFYNENNGGPLGFRDRSSGAGSGVNNFENAAVGNPGITSIQTGTDTGGLANIQTNDNLIRLSGGLVAVEWCFNVETLSTAGDRYIIRAGLGDVETYNASRPNDCVYFEYAEDGTASQDNWRLITSSGGTPTDTDSSTTVSTGYVRLRFEVNSAASSVEFFINDVSVGTNSTNIPSAAMGLNAGIIKTTGTNSLRILADYVTLYQKFTTERGA